LLYHITLSQTLAFRNRFLLDYGYTHIPIAPDAHSERQSMADPQREIYRIKVLLSPDFTTSIGRLFGASKLDGPFRTAWVLKTSTSSVLQTGGIGSICCDILL